MCVYKQYIQPHDVVINYQLLRLLTQWGPTSEHQKWNWAVHFFDDLRSCVALYKLLATMLHKGNSCWTCEEENTDTAAPTCSLPLWPISVKYLVKPTMKTAKRTSKIMFCDKMIGFTKNLNVLYLFTHKVKRFCSFSYTNKSKCSVAFPPMENAVLVYIQARCVCETQSYIIYWSELRMQTSLVHISARIPDILP